MAAGVPRLPCGRRPAWARCGWPGHWPGCTAPSSGTGRSGSGWLARAQRLASQSPETAESGWVALNVGMFEADRGRKEECFRRALDVARRFGDAELEFCTLAYLGASLVHADRPEEGMLLLDEALAAVAGGEVDDFSVLEEIFCQLFSACEHACDVARADQWIRVGEAIAARRNLPAVAAFCRTHYGGVLTAAGRWPEADAALTEAVRLWGLGQRSWRRRGAGPARGPAGTAGAGRGSRPAARRHRPRRRGGGRAPAGGGAPRAGETLSARPTCSNAPCCSST